MSFTLSEGAEGINMATVRKIDRPRVIALTGFNDCDQVTVVRVYVDYNVYSVEYISYRVGAKLM
jgi:hypothetical protein